MCGWSLNQMTFLFIVFSLSVRDIAPNALYKFIDTGMNLNCNIEIHSIIMHDLFVFLRSITAADSDTRTHTHRRLIVLWMVDISAWHEWACEKTSTFMSRFIPVTSNTRRDHTVISYSAQLFFPHIALLLFLHFKFFCFFSLVKLRTTLLSHLFIVL